MKIMINAFQYGKSITGTDRLAYNYLEQLQKLDTSNHYIIVCSREEYTRSVITSQNYSIVMPASISRSSLIQRIYNKIWRVLLPLRLRLKRADVYMSFHNMSLPKIKVAKRMIASNLDLIPLKYQEYSAILGSDAATLRVKYTETSKMSDKIISISHSSRDELIKEIGVEGSKIEVIHLAADPFFMTGYVDKSVINDEYIFTIGGSEPRKNVKTVIKAYQALPQAVKDKYKLVIAGGAWHGRAIDYQKSNEIIELGYVSDESLPSLYANSAAFVFASTYEGFGFTVLEAMSSGTPVINAAGSSLDEIVGDATLSFDPLNSKQLTEKLNILLNDEGLRNNLIKKGYEQNKKFSWEASAKKLHAILVET